MKKEEKHGMWKKMNDGEEARVLIDHHNGKVTIQYRDGVEKLTTMDAYRKRKVTHPKNKPTPENRIKHNPVVQNCGSEAKIVAYRTSKDIDVMFEDDGTIVQHRTWSEFINGRIGKPKRGKLKYEGQTYHQRCGMNCTVIEFLNWENCTVKFADGTVKKTRMQQVLDGRVQNPALTIRRQSDNKSNVVQGKMREKYVGQIYTAKNGLDMRIIEYNNALDVTVQFIHDGTIVENVRMCNIKQGNVAYPKYFTGSRIAFNEFFVSALMKPFGFKKAYLDGLNGNFSQYEFDLVNHELKIAMEYDGSGHNIQRDLAEDKAANQEGYTLYRIREAHLPALNGSTSKVYTLNDVSHGSADLYDVVCAIIIDINKNHNLSWSIDDCNLDIVNEEAKNALQEYQSQSLKREGQMRISNQGLAMIVTEYINSRWVNVRFLHDGTVVEHVTWENFCDGNVKYPNNFGKPSKMERDKIKQINEYLQELQNISEEINMKEIKKKGMF